MLRRTERDVVKKMHINAHVKYLFYSVRFKSNWHFLDRFSKNTQISNLMKICLLGRNLFHVDGQRDRRTDGRAIRS